MVPLFFAQAGCRQRCRDASTFHAGRSIASLVKLKYAYRALAGAESPNSFMPMKYCCSRYSVSSQIQPPPQFDFTNLSDLQSSQLSSFVWAQVAKVSNFLAGETFNLQAEQCCDDIRLTCERKTDIQAYSLRPT